MGALPLNARIAHFRLIFWWRESGITRVRAGKIDWLRRVWTLRSHVHSVGLEVDRSARAHRTPVWYPLSLACGAPHGTQAAQELGRLFPNMQAHIPDGNEEEPTSDAEDDFAEELTAQREGAEHGRAADAAGQLGVPARRPPRAAATAANAAMDALEQRGELA